MSTRALIFKMQNGFVLDPIKKTVREERRRPSVDREYSFWEQLDWAISAIRPQKAGFVNQERVLGTQDSMNYKLKLQTLKLLKRANYG